MASEEWSILTIRQKFVDGLVEFTQHATGFTTHLSNRNSRLRRNYRRLSRRQIWTKLPYTWLHSGAPSLVQCKAKKHDPTFCILPGWLPETPTLLSCLNAGFWSKKSRPVSVASVAKSSLTWKLSKSAGHCLGSTEAGPCSGNRRFRLQQGFIVVLPVLASHHL